MTSAEQETVARARSGPDAGSEASWGYPRIVAVAAGAFLAVAGLWALVGPESFYESLARFPPYNQHFIQDIGAFQIGLGAVLLLASLRPRADVLAVTLLGTGIGSAAHVVSHAIGHDLGGTPSVDLPFFSTLTVLLVTAGLFRWTQTES